MRDEFYYTSRICDLRMYDEIMEATHLLFCAASNFSEDDQIIKTVPPLPDLVVSVGADPGGYVATHKYGGRYPFSHEEYYEWLWCIWHLNDCHMWAGLPDLLCANYVGEGKQRKAIAPDPKVVQLRQYQTTRWAEEYIERWLETPFAWVPTIQGFTVEQYRQHAHQLAPLIRFLYAYYWEMCQICEDGELDAYNQRFESFRVGIGSLVSRDKPEFVREVVLAVQQEIGEAIPLHLWGVKLRYLKAGLLLPGRFSFDTSCFDERFSEKDRQKQKQSGLSQGYHRWVKAQRDYDERVQAALSAPRQPVLFSPTTPNPLAGYKAMHDFLVNQ